MKTITVEIELFEKDDRVITPSGSGIVTKNEAIPINNEREVMVKLDNVPHGVIYGINGWYCILEDNDMIYTTELMKVSNL